MFSMWVLFACICIFSNFCDEVRCDEYSHRTVLDGNGRFHVSWRQFLRDGVDWIKFKVEVEAHGYVGFGFSPNGGMHGSDIATGWIKDGSIYFQDRHGTGNNLPPLDESQDWMLIDGSENDTYTTLEFERKLDTCDEQDMRIDGSTMRLIFAYSDSDPPGSDPEYHDSDKRGSKSAYLLQPEKQIEIYRSNLMHWDIRSPNFNLSSEHRTKYWCTIHRSPELDEKHHIILVEPLIDPGHEEFVHHLLVYECVGGKPEEFESLVDHSGHECYHAGTPKPMKDCEGVFLAWAVGGGDIVLPGHVGISLDPKPAKYFMLEVHYDNPQLKNGITDHSGLRIYYSPHLRKYDAGSLMLGSAVSPGLIIPPRMKNFVVAGHSSPDCLAPVMPKKGVKILGVFLHAHLLGRGLKVRHFRNGVELAPLAEDENYDFNYQDYRYLSKEVDLLPNDQVTVECSYDSTEKNVTTLGGFSTQDEMCLSFLLHYPRLERYASLSVPSLESINKILFNPMHQNLTFPDMQDDHLKNLLGNWTAVDAETVGESLRKAEHSVYCYLGNGEKNSVNSSIAYPYHLKVYQEPSTCNADKLPVFESSGSSTITSKLIDYAASFCIGYLILSLKL